MRRDVFQAIADPTRRVILSLIALQAMTPNAIAMWGALRPAFINSYKEVSYGAQYFHERK